MSIPAWVYQTVFYQIFPDRFANGDPANDPPNVKPWDALPDRISFQGGDFAGVEQHLDYLTDLGVNGLYFCPIFQSPSTHRYNAIDYFKIDPRLGSLEDFKRLLSAAHQRGMHVILDGVFNHCGRGFFAFSDVLENGPESPYSDWFYIKKYPLDAYTPGEAKNYIGWWGFKSLPKFNTKNTQVRRYLLDVTRYWLEQGIDGWRLDVPNEIDDDSFWAEFRSVCRAANPEAYTLGEIWDENPRWVGDDHFHGLMNYPFREAVLKWLAGDWKTLQFANRVEELLRVYPWENVLAQYNLLGSHDTERFMTLQNKDTARIRLALIFQFSYPGLPAVYYGDEIGLEGGKDPDCRRTFPWDRSRWREDLRALVKQLIELRKTHSALQTGDLTRVCANDASGCYVFRRDSGSEKILIVLNNSSLNQPLRLNSSELNLSYGQAVRDLISGAIFPIDDGSLTLELPPFAGFWLIPA